MVRTARRISDRNREQRQPAAEVAGDQHRAAADPIQPGAGRQREQDERRHLDCAEQSRPRAQLEVSTTAAMNGIASWLTWLPIRLTVAASQSFR
jgi:hypothetical protein